MTEMLSPEILRQTLHEKVERTEATALSSLHETVLRWETERLRNELDAAFDEDRSAVCWVS